MDDVEEFYTNLTKDVAVSAAANGIYQQLAFMTEFVNELTDLGDIQGFNECDNPKWHGAHINGFDADENEETDSIRIDLFITDFEQRDKLEKIPHCQNSCHPHPNNPNGGKGDNHGTIQCRAQTSNTKQTAIA